jgi:ATP synthase protein I
MPKPEDKGEVTRKSGIAYAAAGALFVSVVSFLVLGLLLDRWLGTSPWLVVAGIIIGACVGFFEFIRLMSRVS